MSQLLGYPRVAWVTSHTNMHDVSVWMLHHERFPLLPPLPGRPTAPHIFLDCALADPHSEFEKLASDSLGPPEHVVLRHLPNQLDDVLAKPTGLGTAHHCATFAAKSS